MVLLLTVLTASAIAAEQSIPDVQENHWAYDAVQWAVDEGVVAGYPDGTFRPDQEVTEGEFLSLFIRSFEEFKTQDETEDWTDPLYKFAEEKGWPVRGSKPDTSARNKPVTREVVAEIIAAADGINLTGSAAVQYLLDKVELSKKVQLENILMQKPIAMLLEKAPFPGILLGASPPD